MSSIPKTQRIAVVGAGVIGLSTAVSIKERLPSTDVTIIADKLTSDTLSNGAGGLWRPEINLDPNRDNVIRWYKDSLDYFLNLCASSSAGDSGVQQVSGYHVFSTTKSDCEKNTLLEQLAPCYRNLTEREIKLFPSEYKHGIFFTTVVADCRYYLPWLMKRFEHAGGTIEVKHIDKLSEISDDFDVIVNCTGLGAKQLMHDELLFPIRGQTIKVKAPWIKHFYYGDEAYVCPGVDYVTLGAVKDYGCWTMEVNPFQKKYIWDKCVKLVPSLEKAEIMWDWVGLRPYRSSICLNSNIVYCDGKFLKVVNNYGHGGHGVAVSWATAQDAAKLVEKLLNDTFVVSRL